MSDSMTGDWHGNIRPEVLDDKSAMVGLANDTGIFQPGEAEALLGGVLESLHAGSLGEGHQAHVSTDISSGEITGWVYFGPTPNADGVWDLWWIGVAPARQGRRIGGALLRFVEDRVRDASGRLLLVETSSLPKFEPVRRFYRYHQFIECGTVPDFYGPGNGKVIFAKRISTTTPD